MVALDKVPNGRTVNDTIMNNIRSIEQIQEQRRMILGQTILFAKTNKAIYMDWMITDQGSLQAYFYAGVDDSSIKLQKVVVKRFNSYFIIDIHDMDGTLVMGAPVKTATIPVEEAHITFVLRRAEYMVSLASGLF